VITAGHTPTAAVTKGENTVEHTIITIGMDPASVWKEGQSHHIKEVNQFYQNGTLETISKR
jgi:hypothetical protein